jgi:hypothetical protein
MKKTFISLSILTALLLTLFQPVIEPGEGDISTYDIITDEAYVK